MNCSRPMTIGILQCNAQLYQYWFCVFPLFLFQNSCILFCGLEMGFDGTDVPNSVNLWTIFRWTKIRLIYEEQSNRWPSNETFRVILWLQAPALKIAQRLKEVFISTRILLYRKKNCPFGVARFEKNPDFCYEFFVLSMSDSNSWNWN